MKKSFKIVTTMFLCLSLLFGTTIHASAAKSDEAILNAKLAELGTPTELIDIMPLVQKQQIVDEGLVFNSYKIIKKNMDQEATDNSTVGTRDLTPSDLTVYFSIYDYSSTYNGRRVYLNYNWNVVPIWNLTDELGLSWNGDKYLVDSSSITRYTFLRCEGGEILNPNFVSYAKSLTYNGAIWDIPMIGSYQCLSHGGPDLQVNTKNEGYVTLRLVNRTAHTTNVQEQCFGKYLHKMIFPTVSLTISTPYAIGISGTGSYEQLSIASGLFVY